MPIPKPHSNEKEQEFISRFMADPVMNHEYPNQEKRAAIAYSTWKEAHKDTIPSAQRTLTFRIDEIKEDKTALTSEGYLICKARPTRTGIFDYIHDGKLVREYRPPEEVFSQASLDSLKLQPVTYYHPDEMVTAENIKAHQAGTTGQDIIREGDFVACTIKVTDKTAVKNILDWHKAGRPVELSCGYDADTESISGEHPREGHYDAIQKNIRYNHVSIVDQGRAGQGARLILDNKQNGGPKMAKFKKKEIKLDGFHMDEINVEIADDSFSTVERLGDKLDEAASVIQIQAVKLAESQKKLDEAKAEVEKQKENGKKLDAVQAKFDQTAEELKKAKIDVTELSNMDSPRIQGMLKAKTVLEATANKLKVDHKGKTPKDIKVAIIKAMSPDFNHEGRSDDYINARYDSVVEVLDQAGKDVNNSSLGMFIKDAHNNQNQGPKDYRAEWIEKTRFDAMNKSTASGGVV